MLFAEARARAQAPSPPPQHNPTGEEQADLDAALPSITPTTAFACAAPSLSSRLLELKDAKDAGLITEREYEQARAGVMAGAGAHQQQQPAGQAPPRPPSYDEVSFLNGFMSTSC